MRRYTDEPPWGKPPKCGLCDDVGYVRTVLCTCEIGEKLAEFIKKRAAIK